MPKGPKASSPPGAWALGLALACVAGWLCLSPIRDADTWWHLKTGELIWRTWSVPRVDPFSYVLNGRSWVAFEWLFELLMYGVYALAGTSGILALKGAAVAAAFLLYFRAAGATAWAASLLSVVAILDVHFFVERPQIADYLFLGLLLNRLLPLEGEDPPRRLWWELPALAALWTNLHGAVGAMVAVILGIRAASEPERARPWALLAAACGAAVLINPYGLRIVTHAYEVVTFANKHLIFELAPLWRQEWILPPVLFLALGAAAAAVSWREDRFLVLLCAVLGAMSVSMVRHASVYSFAAAVLAARALARRWPAAPGWRAPAAGLAAIALACGVALARHAFFRSLGGTRFEELHSEAARFLDERGVDGRMFHSYELGGYLIWKGYPRRKVFVDGRAPEYGPEFIAKAINWYLPENFREFDAAWDFDYAVIENKERYEARVLDESPRWALVFWDDRTLVYLKRGPKNDALIREDGYRWLRPNRQDYSYLGPALRDPRAAAAIGAEIDRSVRGSARNVNALQLRAMLATSAGRFDEALADLGEAARKAPENPGPLMSLGWTHERKGDAAAARDAYARALAAARRGGDARTEAFLLNNLGSLAFKAGDKREAERLFRRCLTLFPDHPQARQNLERMGIAIGSK